MEPLMKRQIILNGTTKYVGVPFSRKVPGTAGLGVHIVWFDATSNAAITLELSSMDFGVAGDTNTTAGYWVDAGVTITGPVGTAAGGSILNLENVRQRRARLKIVASADTDIEIWSGT